MKLVTRDKSAPKGAQAALRAIRLLKLFTADSPELQLAHLSANSGLNKTTTHRLLQALQSEEMLERNQSNGAYRLGPGMMALGVQALSSNDLRIRTRPLLKRLADETGETATLEVPIDDTMLILDEVSSKHFVGASGNVGTRWPIHATSTGKVLIAFEQHGAERLRHELLALTPRTITTKERLLKQLGDVRHRGFAETVDELEDGFSGVGAVVRGGMGEVVGAVSICGPTQRLSESRRAQLGVTLCSAAASLYAPY